MSSGGELSGSDLFVRHPEVESNLLPDQTVLLFQKDTSLAVPVNAEGAAIWKMCDGAHTIDRMVDNLTEIYDQERNRIDQDVRAFLGELVRLGLVDRLPTLR
jgi:coenzyme PQQ synthesis protein D (PqqD)